MAFRVRIGPFTFGRTGVRFSPTFHGRGSGGGLSVPLDSDYSATNQDGKPVKRRNRTFGYFRFGPFRWFS